MPADIRLVNEARRTVYAFVKADPETTPEELERAVTGFMLDDPTLHDGDRAVAHVVGSFVTAPDICKAFGMGRALPLGWIVGVRVDDPAVFRRVAHGDVRMSPVFKREGDGDKHMREQTASEQMPASAELPTTGTEDRNAVWELLTRLARRQMRHDSRLTLEQAVDDVAQHDPVGRAAMALYQAMERVDGNASDLDAEEGAEAVKKAWYAVIEAEADLLVAKSTTPITRAKALVMAQDAHPRIIEKLMHHCDPSADPRARR